jgi:predicted PurR-regulated permease PerM
MNAQEIARRVTNSIDDWLGQGAELLTLAAWSIAAIFGGFLTLVLLFYFLVGGSALARGALWLVPPARRARFEYVVSRLNPVLTRYFVGVLVVVTYAVIAAYIGLGIFLRIENALFLALLTGVLEMIPIIGPAIAIMIVGLVAVHHAEGFGPIFGFALYAMALRLSIDQLVGPLVLGRAARLHPTLIIFCFLAGGVLLGVTGMILAVPVAVAVKNTLAILYDGIPTQVTHSTGVSRPKRQARLQKGVNCFQQ